MSGVLGPVRDLGPCEVWFGAKDSETKVGESHGGVIFKYSQQSAPIQEDAEGISVQDNIVIGVSECSVTAPFTRLTLLKLASVSPAIEFSSGASGEDNLLYGHIDVGKSCKDNAASLILKPIVDGVVSTDTTEWLYLPLAYPNMTNIEITFDSETQRVYNIIFTGYAKAGTIGGIAKKIYWHIGDDDIVTWV